MSKENAINIQQQQHQQYQQQQQQPRVVPEEDNRKYYDYELNHQPKNSRVETSIQENAGSNPPLSSSAPSNSWMENDQLKQPLKHQVNPPTMTASSSTTSRHRRGVSLSDIKHASGTSSSNVESKIRHFSLNNEPNPSTSTSTATAAATTETYNNNQSDIKRSRNKRNNDDFYGHPEAPPQTSAAGQPPPPPQPQHHKQNHSHPHSSGSKSNPYYSSSMRPPMPIHIDQLSIQDIYAIMEENYSLQMEVMELQRRLRHVTARANYLEELRNDEYPLNAADISKPYSSGKRHTSYYKSRPSTNKGQQKQQQQHNVDEETTAVPDDRSAPAMEHHYASESPDGYHYSQCNNNNNNKEKRRSFDGYSPHYHHQGRFYPLQYDMMDSSPYGMLPPPPPMPAYMMDRRMYHGPPPLPKDKSNRGSSGYDRRMYMRHYYEDSPYNRGFSDEEETGDELDFRHAEGSTAAMEDEAMAAAAAATAAMNDFYSNQRASSARYGPPPSMHHPPPPPPPPPPPNPFMSGPPHPGMMPMYGRQQGPPPPPPPPPQPWMMNDLSPYTESLPHSRRSSIHRTTKSSKSHKSMNVSDEENQDIFRQLDEADEEDFRVMLYRMSLNGHPPPMPPHPGMMGGHHPHPPPPPPPPPPPTSMMNMYGEMGPPPSHSHHMNSHNINYSSGNSGGSLRRKSSRRSTGTGGGNNSGRSSYIGSR
ncbi:hypothetical protein [Parasitella parasitica]|uniref:Uncharacterized protein n=1 Tax=Parasitella parasitica TaxID=35722 RepID=A0A0B7NTV7_9FUNG|nr:hypothetical protein [Parasitella parasitica]